MKPQWGALLQYSCLANWIEVMLLVGCFLYRFAVGFDKQLFQRINLKASLENNVLRLILLTVNAIVPMWYELYLTYIIDKYLSM